MRKLIDLAALPVGTLLKFHFLCEGQQVEAFLANAEGHIVAYQNVCRHIPVSLDYGDGEIFSPDWKFFQCRTHGAKYEPRTGVCVDGPCAGRRLKPVAIRIADNAVWVESDRSDS